MVFLFSLQKTRSEITFDCHQSQQKMVGHRQIRQSPVPDGSRRIRKAATGEIQDGHVPLQVCLRSHRISFEILKVSETLRGEAEEKEKLRSYQISQRNRRSSDEEAEDLGVFRVLVFQERQLEKISMIYV